MQKLRLFLLFDFVFLFILLIATVVAAGYQSPLAYGIAQVIIGNVCSLIGIGIYHAFLRDE